MGEFNSDDHYIYYCGQESLRRNGVAIMVNKSPSPKCSIGLDYHDTKWFALEMNRDHSVIFEIASKYCISDCFVDHDGYPVSSEGFLPSVVDIMVI